MALDRNTIANSLEGANQAFLALKTPLGSKFVGLTGEINKAIDLVGKADGDEAIRKTLEELDVGLDKVFGIDRDYIDNSLSFNFNETLTTKLNSNLPSVSADLGIAWSLTNSASQSAKISDFKLNSFLGKSSFLGSTLENVEDVLKPIRQVITGLTKDIPFLTDGIPKGLGFNESRIDFDKDSAVSVLDLLNEANNFGSKLGSDYTIKGLEELSDFIGDARALLKLADAAQKSSDNIALPGSFTYDLTQKNFLSSGTNRGELPSSLTTITKNLNGFDLPILNTTTAYKLLSGERDVELFEYKMPTFNLVTPPA